MVLFYASQLSVPVTAAFATAIDYEIGIVKHRGLPCCPAIHLIDLGISEHQSADICCVHVEQSKKQTREQQHLSLTSSVLSQPRLKGLSPKFTTVEMFVTCKWFILISVLLILNSSIYLNCTLSLYQPDYSSSSKQWWTSILLREKIKWCLLNINFKLQSKWYRSHQKR